MTENLRLEFDGNTTYDSTTTNLAAGATITPAATQARNGAPTAAEIIDWSFDGTGDTLTKDDTDRWLSRGIHTVDGVFMSESDTATGNLTGENQEFGAYYNWYTATASTGTYGIGTNVVTTQSICPKGWKLPQFPNTNKDYTTLVRKIYGLIPDNGGDYGTDVQNERFHGLPFSVPYSGHTNSQGASAWAGTNGMFWTAVSGNQESTEGRTGKLARALIFEGNSFYPHGNHLMIYGASIRCVNM